MLKATYHLIQILRPRHWIKNLALFAAITFTGQLFTFPLFLTTVWAFASFCLLSSATYIINDIFDREVDKLHPTKKFRPIARGDIKPWFAAILAGLLVVIGLNIASKVTPAFLLACFAYLTLQFAYSTFLQRKWLMATIPFVVYGIMRYLQDIYEKGEGEAPERVLITDKPLLLAVFAWASSVVVVIYLLS